MNYAQDKYTVEYKNRSKGEMIKTPDTEHNAHQRQLRIDTFACAAMGEEEAEKEAARLAWNEKHPKDKIGKDGRWIGG